MKKLRYAIGIDIGGTAIKYGICSEKGDLIQQDQVVSPSDAPNEIILNNLADLINRALEFARQENLSISAIGIGTPGCVDVQRGYLKGGTPNFKYWRDVAIADFVKSRFDLPVFVDNDANVMAYGEFVYGAGRGKSYVICITLGTGIGGGIILNKEIYRGPFYAGAELGHITIAYDGRPCNCGGRGCWERYGSANALIQDYNETNPDNFVRDAREIFDRAKEGESLAQQAIDRNAEYVGAGLASIINIFNPELIIVGGGLSEAGEEYIQKIDKAAKQRSMENSRENVQIKAALLGNKAGLLGAAALALKILV